MKTKLSSIVILLVAAFALLTLQSCKSVKEISSAQLDGKWVLKTFNGENVAESFKGKTPTMELSIADKRVTGTGGCNNYSGVFNLNENEFSAPNLASTMMMCVHQNQEGAFLQLLGKTSTISISEENLVFVQEGKQVLEFVKAQPISAADLVGTWDLHSLQGATANFHFKGNAPTINFSADGKSVNGNAGCNRYNASFVLDGNMLSVNGIGTTRMSCESIDGERKFVELLSSTNDIEVDGNMLILRKDGLEQLRFVRK